MESFERFKLGHGAIADGLKGRDGGTSIAELKFGEADRIGSTSVQRLEQGLYFGVKVIGRPEHLTQVEQIVNVFGSAVEPGVVEDARVARVHTGERGGVVGECCGRQRRETSVPVAGASVSKRIDVGRLAAFDGIVEQIRVASVEQKHHHMVCDVSGEQLLIDVAVLTGEQWARG